MDNYSVIVLCFVGFIIFRDKPSYVFNPENTNSPDTTFSPNCYKDIIEETSVSSALSYNEIIDEYSKDVESPEIVAESFFKDSSINDDEAYRTISITLIVSNEYKTTINFYCITSKVEPIEIKEIVMANLNCKYKDLEKGFNGDLFYNLENSKTIYYSVDGDFYNETKTSFSKNLSDRPKESATIIYEIEKSSDKEPEHYEYIYKGDRIILD